MIVASTPLRISFFGGGSDLPAFTAKETGATLAVTINKYVHVIVKENDRKLRFIHEDISDLDTMRNPIAAAIFKAYGITEGYDVISLSDVPAIGSGLGGSSAFTISLIRAFNQQYLLPTDVAKMAVEIEVDKCNYPIGIQDQYVIAKGGMHLYKFYNTPREGVIQTTFNIKSDMIQTLESRLLLIHSGLNRQSTAGTILQEQQEEMNINEEKFASVRRIRDRAFMGMEFLNTGKLDAFGELLHINWMDKKKLTNSLSNVLFDDMYEFALNNGAIGGKLLGAGGGGFFLFYSPTSELKQLLSTNLKANFPNSAEFPFNFVGHSTKITRI